MKILRNIFVFCMLLLSVASGFATTYYARTSGIWTPGTATSAIFSAVNCSGALSSCDPGSGDIIQICQGITLTVNGNGTIASLTFVDGGCTLAINSLCTFTVSGNIGFIGGGGTFTNNGSLVINGDLSSATGVVAFTNNGTLTVNGTYAVGSTGGTFSNYGTATIATMSLGTSNLTWTNASNSTLNIGAINNNAYFALTATASGNTVNYNGAAQAVKAVNYYHLTLSGSGNKTFSIAETISGTLSIIGTAKAALAAGTNSTANELILGGVGQAAGTWGSTSSIATNKNDTYFTLSTGYVTVSTATGCTKVDGLNQLSVISENKQIKIRLYENTGKQSIVTVYDILGNKVMKETLSNNQVVIDIEVAGTYIVKVKTGDNVYTDKVVVK
ncbi:MAG: T9SS type A sorting domain-containing protein [Bacteroidales bacterium]|nr:T9SS type A sorting domain-containing protein [Bacteroidales bacterium]